MSAAVAYDTLKIARQLAEAGLDQSVAEGVSETFAGVLADREDSLATKADIAALKSDIAALDAGLKTEIRAARHEMRAEMRAGMLDLAKWMITALVAVAGLLFAGLKLL